MKRSLSTRSGRWPVITLILNSRNLILPTRGFATARFGIPISPFCFKLKQHPTSKLLVLQTKIMEASPMPTNTISMSWEPLPQRETTTRQQRRRARTMLTMTAETSSDAIDGPVPEKQIISASNDKGSKNTPNNPAKSKPNRPGFNSYLKVILDDTTMDRMHGVALKIQSKVGSLQGDIDKSENASLEGDIRDQKNDAQGRDIPTSSVVPTRKQESKSPSKKFNTKKQQPLRFKPRSRASLHMTFFFGGETLCELPVEELIDWHGKIRDRLKESSFLSHAQSPDSARNDESSHENRNRNDKPSDDNEINGVIDDYWFDVTDVCMFPPRRNNLIVAILEASPAWHALHNDVRDIAKTSDSQALNEITAHSKDKWTAHITLGNIFGGGSKGQVRKAFDEILEQIKEELGQEQRGVCTPRNEGNDQKNTDANELPTDGFLFKARTHGIAMGGPVPEQAALDWEFTFKPPKAAGKN